MDGGGERHACTAIAAAAPQPAEQPLITTRHSGSSVLNLGIELKAACGCDDGVANSHTVTVEPLAP
jgi:hypothetical protein